MCGVQGLSEPLGALIALLFVKPFLTPLLLQYMLAFVGGIMARSLPSLSTVVYSLPAAGAAAAHARVYGGIIAHSLPPAFHLALLLLCTRVADAWGAGGAVQVCGACTKLFPSVRNASSRRRGPNNMIRV